MNEKMVCRLDSVNDFISKFNKIIENIFRIEKIYLYTKFKWIYFQKKNNR